MLLAELRYTVRWKLLFLNTNIKQITSSSRNRKKLKYRLKKMIRFRTWFRIFQSRQVRFCRDCTKFIASGMDTCQYVSGQYLYLLLRRAADRLQHAQAV